MPKSKIKVLLYIDSLMIGGMHRQILYLAKHLNRDDFEPIVCTQNTPKGGLREEFERSGSKLVDLKRKWRVDLLIIYRLIKLLRAEKPDIIFLNAAPNLFYYHIARIFYRGKIVLLGSFRALTFWKGHLKKHYMPLDNLLAKWLYISSAHTVVNSHAMKRHYSEFLNIDAVKPIEVICNGSDFNFLVTRMPGDVRLELNIAIDEILIIMVARLDPWKDFFTLIDAAKIVVEKNSKVRFIMLGEGKLRPALEEKIAALGLENNFSLIGERKDIFNYINACDISVLSSHGEGFSNSILESMAFAKPVVATNVGGNAELLGTTGEFGFLVPPKSPVQFAQIILKLADDEVLRNKVGQSAKEKILELCSLTTYISLYENLFKQSAAAKNKS
jgi:glycosyltransferase involved in cell wall biosynthesis